MGKHYPRFLASLLLLLLLCASVLFPMQSQAKENTFVMKESSDHTTRKLSVDPISSRDQYSAVLYDNTNGLPTSEANDIAETSNGFLWIGSYSGLIRYDGNEFERIPSTTGINSVISLYTDSRDRLWIGCNDDGVFLLENGEFRQFSAEDGIPSVKINDITEGDDGTVYFGTTNGVAMIGDDMKITYMEEPEVVNSYVDILRPGADGKVYAVTNEGDIFSIKEGKMVRFLSHEENAVSRLWFICPDPKDAEKMYFGSEDSNLYYGHPGDPLEKMEVIDIAPLNSVMDLRVIDEKLWICARNGIGVMDEDGVHILENIPMNNSVGHVIVDYEGNLWFTSTRQGVMKIVANRFFNLFARYKLPDAVVNTTCVDGDDLFVGTDFGLIVLREDGPLDRYPITKAVTASGKDLEQTDLIEMLEGARIRSILPDSKGRLWFSTWEGLGLLRYDHGACTVFGEEDGFISDQTRAVCELPDGSIAVTNSGGVCVIEGDRVSRTYDEKDGLKNNEILCIATGENGDILAGSNGGGLYVISKDGIREIGLDDGLRSGIVMRIRYDEKREVYWLVTSNSLAYMDRDYNVTSIKKFPYTNNFDMLLDREDNYWILSSNGLYVIPAEELMANGEMQPAHYGMKNGLSCVSTSNSYSALTEEGNLYVAGNTGVMKVNIDDPLEDVDNIKIAVPYVEADGKRIYPQKNDVFHISSKTQKLTVFPYVFNYSLTDPEVSYRLEGFDQEQVSLTRSDLVPVDYTNLRGGTYRFVVGLQDALGRNNNSTSVTIVKEKAIYEKPWFYVTVLSLLGIGIAGAVAAYIRANNRKLERKHAESVAKERLDTELKTASAIQNAAMPHTFPPFPDRGEFDIYAAMYPAREVGGDFYDFFLIDEDHLGLVMADVSGKGIPAALFMMVSKVIVQSCAMLGSSARDILLKTNEALTSNNKAEMFVTVWVGILEISTGKITAANAGHEYPILMKNGVFQLVKDKHGLVIGAMEGVPYMEYELQMDPGDKLFLYTDGVPEASDTIGNMFGVERTVNVLNEVTGSSPQEVLEHVREHVDMFVNGAEQFDDLTMMCIEYHGPGGKTE